ncbi:type II secretion system F family protein [uncultured Schumannella sp.]|uniref:type II secretion system F family protein n=1 Tax=uncultured Schumannella sp. TaxID=1195956 RepID=UPI0025D62A1C|nr:type II secretion system F family protein [uncultured Schumannella sp.]
MTPGVLFGGIVLVAFALLAIVFFVIAPPTPRVPIERRIEPGTRHVPALTRATDLTVAAIEATFRGRRGVFSADELELAGVKASPSAFLLRVFIAAAVLALLGVLLGFDSFWSIPLALGFALTAPIGAKVILSVLTSRRCARFADQLDDTLQLLAGNLRAGYGLVQSLDAVARDAEEPTASEFARVVNETRIGRELGNALEDSARRMRSDDFVWVAQAIAINRETGGNLAEVLHQVAATIRERSQIRRQVVALSAEGRLSGLVLIALPFVVFAAVLLIQPAYFAIFFTSVVGVIALVAAVLLLGVGAAWMSAVTRVKF